MEVIAKLRVNDSDTGELLGKVESIFTCDECETLDEFDEEHGDDIAEFLHNLIHPEVFTGNCIERVDIIELMDDYAEV